MSSVEQNEQSETEPVIIGQYSSFEAAEQAARLNPGYEKIHFDEASQQWVVEKISQKTALDLRQRLLDEGQPETLVSLREEDENITSRRRQAADPTTSIESLQILAQDQYSSVRLHVASNPNTPAELLADLGQDTQVTVRNQVAKNPNTPASVLDKLARDPDSQVRCSVAINPSTPVELLKLQITQGHFNRVRDKALESLVSRTHTS